ncbi:bifunctional folylpolyglutamate synthase/dihydrofolate synthase [Cyanobium sp. FGCU-6]|nr:bifunctional folylpolyglutamate synthase/dihydrofolate synthase [Cyanobium sp. FGCU6]
MPASLPAPVDLGDLLEPFARRGVDLGLDRLKAALAEAGDPQNAFAAVQVAGTNGKGSIATQLHAILRAAGVASACYRSPHLVSWCERLELGDAWISPEQLRADLRRWQAIARRHDLTPFELLTAAAFERCAIAGIELAVLEVGLGGRLDATTTHPDRGVVGFGTIGLDHREHLGDTLAAIAAEKAAVMGPGAVAVSGPQEPEAARVLEAVALQVGCELRWVEPLADEQGGGPRLGLAGAWQRGNAAVALGMARVLVERGWAIPEPAMAAGLAAAHWPGRLERRRWHGRDLLLDGAHNPPAAAALRRELDRLDPSAVTYWLLGIQRQKEAPQMVESLLGPADRAWLVPIPDHRCWSAADLLAERPQLQGRLLEARDPAAGLAALLAGTAGRERVVVAGSLHLLGCVMPLLAP